VQVARIPGRHNKNGPLTESKQSDVAGAPQKANTFIHISARCIDRRQMFGTIEDCHLGVATFK
jgi:hypothetical protein